MTTFHPEDYYQISFSPTFTWTLQASPEAKKWLHHFAMVMGLEKTNYQTGSHISISFDSPNIERVDEDYKRHLIQNYYAKYWFEPDTFHISVVLSPETQKCDRARSFSFKTLIITLTTIMQPHGALFLHAATLVKNGEAILVAASSGGGKSTTASRLPPPWFAPGDECCLVIPREYEYIVYPMPTWSAVAEDDKGTKKWNTRQSYRLKSFCVLKQDSEDSLEKIGKAQSIAAITGSARQVAYLQLDRSGKEMNQLYFNGCYRSAEEMIRSIPVYILKTTLSGMFWKELERELL